MAKGPSSQLVPKENPKIIERFDDYPIQALPPVYAVPDDGMVASIQNFGVLSPVIVCSGEGTAYKYKICDGQRRVQASRLAKKETIPVVVYNFDPMTADIGTVMLNGKRTENPVAELLAIERVFVDGHYGEVEIARVTGIAKPKIAKLMKYRMLNPTLRGLFDSYNLPPSLALRIVGPSLIDRQEEVIKLIEQHDRLLSKHLDSLLVHKPKTAPESNGTTVQMTLIKEIPRTVLSETKLALAICYGIEATSVEPGSSLAIELQDKVFAQVRATLHVNGIEVTDDPKDSEPPSSTAPTENTSPTTEDGEGEESASEEEEDPKASQSTDNPAIGSSDGEGPVNRRLHEIFTPKEMIQMEGKLRVTNLYSVENLQDCSVWRFIRETGLTLEIAMKFYNLGLLHDHYLPDAKVVKGWAVGSLLRVRAFPDNYKKVIKHVTGPSGGLELKDTGEGSSDTPTFYTWENIQSWFQAI